MKLTGLDFPEGHLYSRDYLWVRDLGEGRARVGLQFHALPRGGDVYFAKLPPVGSPLERGRAFGFVDLAGSTFELRAPFDARIALRNDVLRDDAGAVATAPFGDGWLVEVDGLAPEDLKGLLDREQALRYYSFIPGLAGKTLAAAQRFDAGRPWPSTTSLKLGDDLIVASRLLPAAGNEAFAPDWATGDRWRVRVKLADIERPRTYEYEVQGDEVVAGDDCWRVRAIEVEAQFPPQSFRRLFFRKDDLTLVAVDDVSTIDPALFARSENRRGREAFLLERAAGAGDEIIVDHPRMPAGCDDEARDVAVGHEPPITQIVRFRAGASRMEVELRAEVGGERLVSVQTWERGRPWWKDAARVRGGEETVRAELVQG